MATKDKLVSLEVLKATTQADVNDLKSAITNADNSLIYGDNLRLMFAWENGVINSSYEEVNNSNPSQARTKGYFTPQKNMTLTINRVNVNAVICVVYASDGTPVSRTAYTDSTTPFYISLESSKKYRFCITAESNVDLSHTESNAIFSLPILTNTVGTPQLTSDLSALFKHLVDTFSASSRYASSNVTYTKTGNGITWACTDDSSYIIYNATCTAEHKYVLYYDLSGTLTDGNYGFNVRLFNSGSSSWATNTLASLSQTTGADAEGTFVFTVPSASGGYLSFDFVNENGQSISGNFYLYDVTGLSANDIARINFAEVGAGKTVIVGIDDAGGSPSGYWADKKVVFYGDSITAQNKYPVTVQNYYGFTMVNASVGGARISYRGSGDTDMSVDSRLEALPSDADVVFIMGGTNDWGKVEIEQTLTYNDGFDRTKFKGGLAYIIKKIQAQCPNATLVVATLIGGRNETRATDTTVPQYLPEADQYGQTDLDFRNAEIEVANMLNIRVCDTWSCGINGNNASTMIADTVHPTDAGNKLIADYIIGYFNTLYVG